MHRILVGLTALALVPLAVITLMAAGRHPLTTTQAAQLNVPDNRGTEFVLALNQNYDGGGSNTLFIGADDATTATVSIPGIGFGPTDFPIVPGTITSVDIPLTARLLGSGAIESKGILVTAPKEIFVYGLNQQSATTDAFLGLPSDIQGTDYVIPTYFNLVGAYPSELGIAGITDDTTITITPAYAARPGADTPAALPAGTPFNITLDRLQTFQLQDAGVDSTGDLTGTTITSDKPISVYGAHVCVNVPVGIVACDHLVEEIPRPPPGARNSSPPRSPPAPPATSSASLPRRMGRTSPSTAPRSAASSTAANSSRPTSPPTPTRSSPPINPSSSSSTRRAPMRTSSPPTPS